MTISDFVECLNKAYENKYNNKGFFVVTKQWEEDNTFPIYKKLTMKLLYFPEKKTVFTVSMLDRVPTNEQLEFEDKCAKELITTILSNMDIIYGY